VAARGDDEGSPAYLLVVMFPVELLWRVLLWLQGGCSVEPFLFACLLPPVAGATSLMAGCSSPSAPALLRFLRHLSSCFGAGSPLHRALPRRQVIAVKHPRSLEDYLQAGKSFRQSNLHWEAWAVADFITWGSGAPPPPPSKNIFFVIWLDK
jgi:hypothetical protein